MKRVLPFILAIAAAIIVHASAFAQLTWNGYYRTGGGYYAPSSGAQAFNYADRLRLNISYVDADNLFGAKFRLQGNGVSNPAGVANGQGYGFVNAFSSGPKYGYAFVNLFGGVVKVTSGKLDITDYEVVQQYEYDQFLGNVYTDALQPGTALLGAQCGTTTGAIVQVQPMAGLSVAMFDRIDGSSFNAHDLGFAAAYTVSGLGKVLFNSSIGHYAPNSGSALAGNATADDFSKSYFSLAFSYTGVKNLTATAGLRYDGDTMYNSSYNTATSLIAILDYNMADLLPMTVDLATDLDFANANSYVEGEINYTVAPQLKLRPYGEYDSTSSLVKLNYAGKANKYMVGCDLVFPAGKAAEFDAGFNYGDQTNLGIPLLVKANF